MKIWQRIFYFFKIDQTKIYFLFLLIFFTNAENYFVSIIASCYTFFHPDFVDERLPPLLLHYKARSFPRTLSEAEALVWEQWRAERISRQLPVFMQALARISSTAGDTQQFMLEELKLWAEAVMPENS